MGSLRWQKGVLMLGSRFRNEPRYNLPIFSALTPYFSTHLLFSCGHLIRCDVSNVLVIPV
jgi:hypothetical protein